MLESIDAVELDMETSVPMLEGLSPFLGLFLPDQENIYLLRAVSIRSVFGVTVSVQQHICGSPGNDTCTQCLETPGFGTRQVLSNDKLSHIDDSIPSEVLEDDDTATSAEYLGTPHSVIAPVYDLALRLRFKSPTSDSIILQTKTTMDYEAVSSIIEATQRLVPVDNPQGVATRKERYRSRAAKAKCAEQEFCLNLKSLGYDCISEDQQKGLSDLTPDVRFNKPTLGCGHMCWWIEYKHFFGFKANPFWPERIENNTENMRSDLGLALLSTDLASKWIISILLA
jgi:hypothetical protein